MMSSVAGHRAYSKSPLERQDDLLLTLLEASPDQLFGKFSATVTKKSKKELWTNVAITLNSVQGGCQKNPDQWEQYFRDKRNLARATASHLYKHIVATGGNVPLNDFMEDFDLRILLLSKIGSFAPLPGAVDSNDSTLREMAKRDDGIRVHPEEIPEGYLYQLLVSGAAVKSTAKNGLDCVVTKMPDSSVSTTYANFLRPLPSSSTSYTAPLNGLPPTTISSKGHYRSKATWSSATIAGAGSTTSVQPQPNIIQTATLGVDDTAPAKVALVVLSDSGSDEEDISSPIQPSSMSPHPSTSKYKSKVLASIFERSPPPVSNILVQTTPSTPLEDLSAMSEAISKHNNKQPNKSDASESPPSKKQKSDGLKNDKHKKRDSKAYTRRQPQGKSSALDIKRDKMMATLERMADACEKQNELKQRELDMKEEEINNKKKELRRKSGSASE